jgi:RND family efflux transporter MFP subunit
MTYVALLVLPHLLVATGAEAQEGPSPVVWVAPIIEKQLPEVISVVGTIEPARRSVAGSAVAGLVRHMPVRQGDAVKQGQLICQLDNTELKLQHRRAEAELSATSEQIGELQAVADQWEYEKKRIDSLYESDAANETEFRNITTKYTAAQRRLAQARHQLAAQQALVDRLADQLSKTAIKAPFAGFVVELHTEVGQWLNRGGPVVEMIDLSTVLVRVDAPAAVLPFVRTGLECTVTVDAVDRQFTGTIKHIIRQVDELARTLPIEIELVNGKHLLAAGMFARASVPAGATKSRLLVSRDAVAQRGETRLVYVVRDQSEKAAAMPVVVRLAGEYEAGMAIEGKGLAPGDQVVVRGNEQFLLFPPGPISVRVQAPTTQESAVSTQATTRPSSIP